MIAAQHPASTAAAAKRAIDAAFAANARAASIWPYADPAWKGCTTGNPKENDNNPKLMQATREHDCAATVANLYKVYNATGDDAFWAAAVQVYGYALSKKGLGPGYAARVEEYLQRVWG